MDIEYVEDRFVRAYLGEFLALVDKQHTRTVAYPPHNDNSALTLALLNRRCRRSRHSTLTDSTPTGCSVVRLDNLDRFSDAVGALPETNHDTRIGPSAYGIHRFDSETYDILSVTDRWAHGYISRPDDKSDHVAGTFCTGCDEVTPEVFEAQVAETPCFICGEESDTADQRLVMFDLCVDYGCIGLFTQLLDSVWEQVGDLLLRV